MQHHEVTYLAAIDQIIIKESCSDNINHFYQANSYVSIITCNVFNTGTATITSVKRYKDENVPACFQKMV